MREIHLPITISALDPTQSSASIGDAMCVVHRRRPGTTADHCSGIPASAFQEG
jgi:hypothetical protein